MTRRAPRWLGLGLIAAGLVTLAIGTAASMADPSVQAVRASRGGGR